MPCMLICRLVCPVLLLAGMSVRAQELRLPETPEILHMAPAPSERFPARWYPRVGDGTEVVPAPVAGKPYTATVETVTPTKSPSGEAVRWVTMGFQARDRAGRVRNEAENGGMTLRGQEVKTKGVLVDDPVSHCHFHWTEPTTDVALPPEERVAFVICGPQTLRYKELDVFGSLMDGTPDGTVRRGEVTTQTEHLPPVQIDGVPVRRLRVTGTSRNETGEIRRWASETWYSSELQQIIRYGDEESGYTGLTQIHRTEPDPKLFYPPEGFRIEVQAAR